MILRDLQLLIKTGQVELITLVGKSKDESGDITYCVKIQVSLDNLDPILKTGRTCTEKTYTSADRAIKAMQNLGYKGVYRIELG